MNHLGRPIRIASQSELIFQPRLRDLSCRGRWLSAPGPLSASHCRQRHSFLRRHALFSSPAFCFYPSILYISHHILSTLQVKRPSSPHYVVRPVLSWLRACSGKVTFRSPAVAAARSKCVDREGVASSARQRLLEGTAGRGRSKLSRTRKHGMDKMGLLGIDQSGDMDFSLLRFLHPLSPLTHPYIRST